MPHPWKHSGQSGLVYIEQPILVEAVPAYCREVGPFQPTVFCDSVVSDGPTEMSIICDAVKFWIIVEEHRLSEVRGPNCQADNAKRGKTFSTNRVRKQEKKANTLSSESIAVGIWRWWSHNIFFQLKWS